MKNEELLCCQIECAVHTFGQLCKFVVEGNKERVNVLNGFGAGNDSVAEDVVEVSSEVGVEIVVE
jgi:hypothetical protein